MNPKNIQAALKCVLVTLVFVSSAQAASNFKVIYYFKDLPAANPTAGLVADAVGNFYGTTANSKNPNDRGTVFKLTRTSAGGWKFNIIHRFKGPDGQGPSFGNLIFDSSGNLYGTTVLGGAYGFGTVFELSPSGSAWTEKVLYSFGPPSDDINTPSAALTWDAAGNLYGTAFAGGTNNNGGVFELATSGSGWNEKVLYTFTGPDGSMPITDLTWDSAGDLYGTTTYGGTYGKGIVFELTPSFGGWTETILYSFTGGADGWIPESGVIFDTDGNLYGTAYVGGSTSCPDGYGQGCGAIYQLVPSMGSWMFNVLHTFDGVDGSQPDADLTLDSAGNLYGTALSGGLYCKRSSCDGVLFKLSQSGGSWIETVLHSFRGITELHLAQR
jgi:uncharacterized repeat protein (TIGR03803 family)